MRLTPLLWLLITFACSNIYAMDPGESTETAVSITQGLCAKDASLLLQLAKWQHVGSYEIFRVCMGITIASQLIKPLHDQTFKDIECNDHCIAKTSLGLLPLASFMIAFYSPVITPIINRIFDWLNADIDYYCPQLDNYSNKDATVSPEHFRTIAQYVLHGHSAFLQRLDIGQALFLALIDFDKFKSFTNDNLFSQKVNSVSHKYLELTKMSPKQIAEFLDKSDEQDWIRETPVFFERLIQTLSPSVLHDYDVKMACLNVLGLMCSKQDRNELGNMLDSIAKGSSVAELS